MPPRKKSSSPAQATSYQHPDAQALIRPEIGTQTRFKKKKPAAIYRYDSSLAPELCWDSQNPARELGAFLLDCIEEAAKLEAPHQFATPREFIASNGTVVLRIHGLADAVRELKALEKPFLNWSGKAERLSFDVPTLPLFIHERLSTQAILDSVSRYKADKQLDLFGFFGHPDRSLPDQLMKAYEHPNGWQNRMVLGDSMVVMNSLLHYENMGGQVQMIYIDPPYGVKFGSNFQPFVRKRDVGHNDDEAMTREPEMVKAYRDTWELGLHSYLTYLRDRLLLARDLLTATGSVFVQISDENLHHVREVMDEVFGGENSVVIITVRKTTSEGSSLMGSTCDFLLWYARDKSRVKYRPFYVSRSDDADLRYDQVLLDDGTVKPITPDERDGITPLPDGARQFRLDNITSSRPAGAGDVREFSWNGQNFTPGAGTFKTNQNGLEKLAAAERLHVTGKGKLAYRRFKDDFGFAPIANLWADISGAVQSRSDPKVYVVQTSTAAIERCLLMTTDPGDLVLDPTCVRKGTGVLAPPSPPVHGGGLRPPPKSEPEIESKQGELLSGELLSSPPCTGGLGGVTQVTPIESIQPGDYVYSHDGQPHKVIRTIRKQYHGTMVGIRHGATSGVLWLTEDHKVLIKKRRYVFSGKNDWSHNPNESFEKARKLRNNTTVAENLLWQILRGNQLGVKFRRQHPIGPYIVDFFCRESSLVVEVDGDSHFTDDAIIYDKKRTEYLTSSGITVIRFTNHDISVNLEGVGEKLLAMIGETVDSFKDEAFWLRAEYLRVGDTVYHGTTLEPSSIIDILVEETSEEVYDLEIEGTHSFITGICAVHNCGSGTTAVVAESWGRRWITIDTSRVPLALARQRLLTATFKYWELKEPGRGPAGGFVYKEKKNNKGEHVGGIVPHITLGSIANNEPPKYEVLVDRPEAVNGSLRVSGPFVFEATIPTASNFDGYPSASLPVHGEGALPPLYGEIEGGDAAQDFTERMIEVLRASPVLHLDGGRTVQLSGIRRPAKTLWLSAEAMSIIPSPALPVHGEGEKHTPSTVQGNGAMHEPPPVYGGDGGGSPVAILFGPEQGALSEVGILEAWQEASAKQFSHLYVIGFAIEPKARQFVEDAGKIGLPATYVSATPDILMGDLLKNMRSSQIFSVCGHPDVRVDTVPVPDDGIKGQIYHEVQLRGLDVFDPVTMELTSYENLGRSGLDVPAWFLDTDYNGLVFRVCQAFFPRTQAWDNLKRALKADFDDSVWAHLAGDTSTPFMAGTHKQIAVKVIDDRGNELMVVRKLEEGR